MEQIKQDWDTIVNGLDMASKAGVYDIHQAGLVSNAIERTFEVIKAYGFIVEEKEAADLQARQKEEAEFQESKNVSKK